MLRGTLSGNNVQEKHINYIQAGDPAVQANFVSLKEWMGKAVETRPEPITQSAALLFWLSAKLILRKLKFV